MHLLSNYIGHLFYRYYSITTKQQTLQGILRDMKSKTQKGQFITRKDVTELMNAFQIEQPTSNQYFNSLMFFGILT